MLVHLLDASYLYAIDDVPPGQWPRGALLWALVSLALAVLSGWRLATDRPGRCATLGAFLSACATLVWVAVRPWLIGPFSARVWPLGLSVIALGSTSLPYAQRMIGPLDGPGIRAMGLLTSPSSSPMALRRAWIVACCHAVGLALLIAANFQTLWLAVLATLHVVGVWLADRKLVPKPRLRIELLAPLWLVHGSTALTFVVETGLGVDTSHYAAFAYPDPWSIWFNTETMAVLAGLWMTATVLSYAGRAAASHWPSLRQWLLLGATPTVAIFWYAATLVRHLSHGATGSDPYCYLQMASDLAQRGTALHDFSLTGMLAQLDLTMWPALHVGYQLPTSGMLAPTVWPIGWPVMLAPLVGIGGESLAMWGAPICALLTAMATWFLALELWPTSPPWQRHMVGAIAAALTLTSAETVLRSLVPMADAASALWTVLFFLFLVRAQHSPRMIWDVFSGIALGMAYWVRHPLLWLVVGAVVCYASVLRNKAGWLKAGLFCASALLVALPDLAYHTRHWGSPWHTESPEWFLISMSHIRSAFYAMLENGLLRRNELGFLWPFIGVGMWAHSRDAQHRQQFWILISGILCVLLFALCYEALRWRDLLALLPLLSLWAAAGILTLWRKASRSTIGRVAALGLCLVALAARATPSYRMPLNSAVWTFGHITQTQRAAFCELDHLLPQDAIIATGLNSGAVERYTGRTTVRPSSWSTQQFQRFAVAISESGAPLYIVDDGEEIEDWIGPLVRNHGVSHLADLPLPCSGLGGQPLDRPARLYLVTRRHSR